MPGPTLTVDELAEEIGRKTSWVYDNWRAEAAAGRLPQPLHDGRPPLIWSRAQVVAIIDRGLSRPVRIAAQAYRAAEAAAEEAHAAGRRAPIVEDATARINAMLGISQGAKR